MDPLQNIMDIKTEISKKFFNEFHILSLGIGKDEQGYYIDLKSDTVNSKLREILYEKYPNVRIKFETSSPIYAFRN